MRSSIPDMLRSIDHEMEDPRILYPSTWLLGISIATMTLVAMATHSTVRIPHTQRLYTQPAGTDTPAQQMQYHALGHSDIRDLVDPEIPRVWNGSYHPPRRWIMDPGIHHLEVWVQPHALLASSGRMLCCIVVYRRPQQHGHSHSCARAS